MISDFHLFLKNVFSFVLAAMLWGPLLTVLGMWRELICLSSDLIKKAKGSNFGDQNNSTESRLLALHTINQV